jgi:seryl-tRNA synthetase
MIELKAFRNDSDEYLRRLRRKGAGEIAEELLAADAEWRSRQVAFDEVRAEQRALGKPTTPEEIDEARRAAAGVKAAQAELTTAEQRVNDLLLRIPNPPDDSVPDGDTEEDAVEVRSSGAPPEVADAKEHTEVGRFDMERAARISGARFGYLVGDTALLALSLYRFALDRVAAAGFLPILPPVLVREEALVGTGHFPAARQDVYAVPEDELYLAGTAEIPVASLHAGEILDAGELPLRYVAFSPCFRREAGAAGRDTRGMFRVHQFNKVEQFSYSPPDSSWDELELLLANAEGIARDLGVPYRIVVLPAGDMSAASAKTYDLELWFPSQSRYREAASISNTTDYQARRVNVRARGEGGIGPVHLLNGTALTDRYVLAVLENFGGDVPAVLREYGAPERVTR